MQFLLKDFRAKLDNNMAESLTIAIDYDGTFTADVKAWTNVIQTLQAAGHKLVCICARYNTDANFNELKRALPENVLILLSESVPKQEFAKQNNIEIDIWIDDMPEAINSTRSYCKCGKQLQTVTVNYQIDFTNSINPKDPIPRFVVKEVKIPTCHSCGEQIISNDIIMKNFLEYLEKV